MDVTCYGHKNHLSKVYPNHQQIVTNDLLMHRVLQSVGSPLSESATACVFALQMGRRGRNLPTAGWGVTINADAKDGDALSLTMRGHPPTTTMMIIATPMSEASASTDARCASIYPEGEGSNSINEYDVCSNEVVECAIPCFIKNKDEEDIVDKDD